MVFSQRPYAYERNAIQQVLWFIDAQRDPNVVCDLTTGDHVGYLATGAFNPAGTDVFNCAISDNHVEVTAVGVTWACAPVALHSPQGVQG